jgi:hypothetical protein
MPISVLSQPCPESRQASGYLFFRRVLAALALLSAGLEAQSRDSSGRVKEVSIEGGLVHGSGTALTERIGAAYGVRVGSASSTSRFGFDVRVMFRSQQIATDVSEMRALSELVFQWRLTEPSGLAGPYIFAGPAYLLVAPTWNDTPSRLWGASLGIGTRMPLFKSRLLVRPELFLSSANGTQVEVGGFVERHSLGFRIGLADLGTRSRE